MTDDESARLRRVFVETGSEEAFERLVAKHAPLVFGTALRRLGGDRAAAEDIAQEVFILLARKAARLDGVVLAGWLHRQTCRRVANFVRAETRRRRRERAALHPTPPHAHPTAGGASAEAVDAALARLPARDRDVLFLRYFEGAGHAGVARALGISEEAARKRGKRALDRLGGILTRGGPAMPSHSLGGTLAGWSAEPLSAGTLRRLASAAARPARIPTGPAWLHLFKPVAAGVVAGSLVSAGFISVRGANVDSAPPAAETAGVAAPPPPRRPPSGVADESSLESILTEIRHAIAGPSHSWSSLRLGAAFERLGHDRIPDFIAIANARLRGDEKAVVYQPLLEHWLSRDAAAAMTFALVENLGAQVDPFTSGTLLHNLFRTWLSTDAPAAAKWLAEWRGHPGSWATSHVVGNLTDRLLDAPDHQPLRDFIQSLESDAERRSALDWVIGDAPWGNLSRFRSVSAGLHAYGFLADLPDSPCRDELQQKFLSHWMRMEPGVFEQAAAKLDTTSAFQVALARLRTRGVSGSQVATLSGGILSQNTPTDPFLLESQAIDAASRSGIPRQAALEAIGTILIDRLPTADALAWIDAHRDDVRLDDPIAAKASGNGYGLVGINGVPGEIIGIQWAARIQDPSRRLRASRALFRKLDIRAPEAASEWLDHADFPSDLREPLRSVLKENR